MAGGDLYSWLLNSFLVTSASVGISTALAALAAYPLSLMRWRAGPFVYAALIALLVVPPIVLVVPLFELVVDLRQLNTLHTVIVIYTGIMLPFSTFLLASFFATISRPLLEAARIDGAGSWRAFWEIVIPLSVPALMTVGDRPGAVGLERGADRGGLPAGPGPAHADGRPDLVQFALPA